MLEMVYSCIQIFADDTNPYTKIQDNDNVALLQGDLERLQEWEKAWQLNFNLGKCKVLHLGETNQYACYHMTKFHHEQLVCMN